MFFIWFLSFFTLFVLAAFVYWFGNKIFLATKRDERKFNKENQEEKN